MLHNLVLLIVATTSLIAQTGPVPMGIRQHYKPGDTIRYTVTFDGDPNFDNVSIYFAAGQVSPDQSGLTNGFNAGRSKKSGPGRFEVEGEIPSNVASGTYRLSSVETRIAPNGAKGYDAGEFHEAVEVDNGVRYEFPTLKSVVPR
jgi:hypothetical protein